MFFATRCAAFGDGGDFLTQQRFREFARIGDGGRAENEHRARTVERAHALQPANHVGHVRTENPAIGVHLVDHYVLEVLEELCPLGVVGQNALVQHVRVGDDDIALGAHGLARVAGRVAVERVRADTQFAGVVDFQNLRHLVLRQRLGGKEIERLRLVADGGVEHRQVVAQRLARCGRCDDDRVPASGDVLPRLALMGVKPRDAAFPQGAREPHVEPRREVGVGSLAGRHHQFAGDAACMLSAQAFN